MEDSQCSPGTNTVARVLSRAPPLSALAGVLTIVAAALAGAGRWPLTALALAALALTGALALQAGRHAATTAAPAAPTPLLDAVTGLPSVGRLRVDLEKALTDATSSTELTLQLFIVEGLKKYNDAYGHACGDALLAWLARRLREVVGTRGTAYRLRSGDFALLANGPAAPTTELRNETAAALIEVGDGFMTWSSVGEVALPREARAAGQALKIADGRAHAQRRTPQTAEARRPPDDPVEALRFVRPRYEIAELASALGRRVGVPADELEDLEAAAQLRDVGNMAIPSVVLAHRAELTEHEWRFIRLHTLVGERLLAANFGMERVATIVRSSHERFDGGGYPDGLRGTEIPLGSRIVFVCSAFQDMTSQRPHRPARSATSALAELADGAGTQFDPDIVAAFQDELSALTSHTPTPLDPKAWRRMRVLVADDDAASRFLLRRAVEAAGHTCIAAEDGRRAWEAYQRDLPEVVISDWFMPEIDGEELCRRIRGDPDAPYSYVIMLTALEDKDRVLRGMRAGADDFLTKPLDRADLEMRLIAAARVTALQRRVHGQQQVIQAELDLAAGIQAKLLPSVPPAVQGVELAGRCVPAANVGGDYFDYLLDRAGRVVLLIADVAGHGVAAALMMAMAREILRREVAEATAPAKLLDRANRALFEDLLSTELFITAFCARYDPHSHALEYASAGHNPPLLCRHDGAVSELQAEGTALGILLDGGYEQSSLRLCDGDTLLLYTDGVVEALDPHEQPFGEKRLQRMLAKGRHQNAAELVDHVLEAVEQHSNGQRKDDVTLLAMESV